ncbi:MAG: tetratricopeptide repeat protein [Syntrophorhabdales bacterium]|nr:tetratricopeptide repeat protein [Syntrophorhabdales bacterium]
MAYNNRGYTYKNLGNYKQAIRNFKIAARLGHKDAQDYLREEGISR